MHDIWQMTQQGNPLTAIIHNNSTLLRGRPSTYSVFSIEYLWFGNLLSMNLHPVLLMLEKLKEWVMLDIYLPFCNRA